jgi:hypothetical protein
VVERCSADKRKTNVQYYVAAVILDLSLLVTPLLFVVGELREGCPFCKVGI